MVVVRDEIFQTAVDQNIGYVFWRKVLRCSVKNGSSKNWDSSHLNVAHPTVIAIGTYDGSFFVKADAFPLASNSWLKRTDDLVTILFSHDPASPCAPYVFSGICRCGTKGAWDSLAHAKKISIYNVLSRSKYPYSNLYAHTYAHLYCTKTVQLDVV